MNFQEYPKALYKGADTAACLAHCLIVSDAEQEATAREDGFELFVEIQERGEAPAQAAAEQEVATPAAPVAAAKPGRKPKAK